MAAGVLDTFTVSLAQFSTVEDAEEQDGDITVHSHRTPKVYEMH
jgi:hypothetical protein